MVDLFVQNNEADIRLRYEEDLKRLYKKPQRAKIRQIIVKPDGESDVRARMDKILAEAKAGADFAELARKHSDDFSADNGGDVGIMAEQQLSPSVASAVFGTKAGEITDVATESLSRLSGLRH